MCGIAGIVSPEERALAAIGPMTAAQAHRGPDGEGFALAEAGGGVRFAPTAEALGEARGHAVFGHRRLAILDLSDAGQQPMRSDDGRYWITYNGEVYNYLELRRELEALGIVFRTQTDTEVVLEAYRQWGTGCFSRFNGMWALGIWDSAQDELMLARDRFGIKPLHYTSHGGALYFASEIKGLLAVAGLPRRLNRRIGADFLRWGMVNHSNETFFAGIEAFPPAHFARISRQAPTQWSPARYWTPPGDDELARAPLSMADAETAFRTLFLSAVTLRLRSDVPVGSCLSGGLDSSAIVCAAAQHKSAHGMKTFTSAARDPKYDERRWSDMVVSQCKVEPHYVFPDGPALERDLRHLIDAQEEPFPSASIYAQYLLMQAARGARVPVLLDGQGADEILCGYRKYIIFNLQEQARARRPLSLLADLGWWALHGDRGLLRLAEGLRYLPAWFPRDNVDPLGAALKPAFQADWVASRLAMTENPVSSYRQLDDLQRYSVPSLLRYEDRNSMAWSVESRVPFLDYRLVEFMLKLPTRLKVHHSQTKAVLRRALRGLVPDAILDRRDKMGFVTAQHEWMTGPLRLQFEQTLRASDLRIAPLIDGHRAADLLARTGYWQAAALNAVFRVFILEQWARHFEIEV